jgi:Tubulin-tyrosine ligase family
MLKFFDVDSCFPDLINAFLDAGMKDLNTKGNISLMKLTESEIIRFKCRQKDLKHSGIENFFPNNREFANKSHLTRNINSTKNGGSSYFPCSFYLKDSSESESFRENFQWCKLLGLLKGSNTKKKISRDLLGSIDSSEALLAASTYLGLSGNYLDTDEGLTSSFPSSLWSKLDSLVECSFDSVNSEELNLILSRWKIKDCQYNLVQSVCPVWVVKPGGKSRGRGIYLISSLTELPKDGSDFVVQKYIESPLVIDDRKFDIRVWVLILSWDPLTVYVYQQPYCRMAVKKLRMNKLDDKFSHLTNNSISKKSKYFQKEASMCLLNEFCSVSGKDMRNYMTQIESAVVESLSSCADKIKDNGNYELTGFDFMIDSNDHVWLLEINASPDLSYSTPVTKKLVKQMMPDLAKILLSRTGKGPEYVGQFKKLQIISDKSENFHFVSNMEIRGKSIQPVTVPPRVLISNS